MRRATRILVVGGGPAGLATALFLAKHGLAATVLDKGDWPRDKVCGQGVMPCGVKLLKDLGLTLNEMPGCALRGVQFHGGTDVSARAVLPEEDELWGIERRHLSRALYEQARTRTLITLRSHTRLVSLSRQRDEFRVGLRTASGLTHETYDCVIAADGLRSTTARLLTLPERSFALPQRLGMRQHFRLRPWSDLVDVAWHEGFELYATPVGPDVVAIAALTWPGHLPKGTNRLLDLVAQSPFFRERLRDATPLDRALVYGPLGLRRTQPTQEGCLLVGDAFCFWDGITGEGIATSLVQARLVADHLATSGLEGFAKLKKDLTRTLRPYLFTTGLALRLSRHPRLRNAAFTLLRACPSLFRAFITWSAPRPVRRAHHPSPRDE